MSFITKYLKPSRFPIKLYMRQFNKQVCDQLYHAASTGCYKVVNITMHTELHNFDVEQANLLHNKLQRKRVDNLHNGVVDICIFGLGSHCCFALMGFSTVGYVSLPIITLCVWIRNNYATNCILNTQIELKRLINKELSKKSSTE